MDLSVSNTPPRFIKPILIGGLIAGLLDEASAMKTYGWGVPRAVASGLLGNKAFDNGSGTWLLGLGLHFLIAIISAAIFCRLSTRLKFLRENYIVSGAFLGIAVFLVMNAVVLPLSAVPFPVGPFTVDALRSGLLVHIFLIGLPISISLRFFSSAKAITV